MFDTTEYLNLSSDEEKITYLNDLPEKYIELHSVGNSDYNKLFHGSTNLLYALAKKRFVCGGMSILTRICHSHSAKTDFIVQLLSLYEENGWFTTPSEMTILHDIFTYEDFVYPRNESLYDYCIELYDRLNIPINIKNGWRTPHVDTLDAFVNYGPIKYFVKLLKLYISRALPIDKNIFIKFISRLFYKLKKDDATYFIELVDICTANNINMSNQDDLVDWRNNRIDPLYCVSMCIDNWDCLKKIISIHLDNHLPININNQLLINIGKHYCLDANKFILEYCKKENQDIHYRTNKSKSYTDEIIQHNSLEILQYVLSLGIIPSNNVITKYVPCPECYNGESHSCNFRNITTEYILLKRYGKRLSEINTLTFETPPVSPPVSFSYEEFDGDANSREIYVEPGIDILSADTDYDDDRDYEYEQGQNVYKIPPKKIIK